MHTGKLKRRIKITGAALFLIIGFLFSANLTAYAQDGAVKKLNDENLRDTDINPYHLKGEYELKYKRRTGSTVVGDTTCGGGDQRPCAPTAAPVPEPVTLILFGTGLAAIGYRARKSLGKKG